MLILTRRIGESLIIEKNIKVTVLGIKGNQVRLGIEAPKTIPVCTGKKSINEFRIANLAIERIQNRGVGRSIIGLIILKPSDTYSHLL
jgi:carbon storage regulator